MIHLPILNHIRRLLASAVIFGTAVLLMLWLPVRLLRYCWPSFLPYTVTLHSEAQVNELSLELLLLQVIININTLTVLPVITFFSGYSTGIIRTITHSYLVKKFSPNMV